MSLQDPDGRQALFNFYFNVGECADAFSAPSTRDRAEILSGAKYDCC